MSVIDPRNTAAPAAHARAPAMATSGTARLRGFRSFTLPPLVCWSLLATLQAGPVDLAGRVTGVHFQSFVDRTQVVVETAGILHFRSHRLSKPDRIFIDLSRIDLSGADLSGGRAPSGTETIPVGDPLVKRIRIARTRPGTTRIVLDLAAPVESNISEFRNPNRLIIEVRKAGGRRPTAATEAIAEPPPPPQAVSGLALPEPALAPRAPAGTLTLQEALESTLRRHPQARIGEQQVAASRGVLREASGIFDTVYSSGLQQSFAPTPLTTAQQELAGGVAPTSAGANLTTFNAGAGKLYRSGITAGPVVELDRARDRLLNAAGINQARLAYQMTIPLLRNRGAEVVAAQETSAGVQVEASKLDLNQTFTDLLTNTAVDYWDLVGAMRLLEVAISSQERGRMLVENVDALVRADRIPRNDVNEVRANLADRIAGRIAAEQQVVVARQQLALAMGLPPEDMASIAEPAEDLPEGIGAPANDPETVRRYTGLALTQRSDYLAARRRVEAESPLLAQAKNALRPSVDLTLSTGYSGLREGIYPSSYLVAPFYGVRGLDAIAGVRYLYAPRNNVAAGRLAQIEASTRQAELRAADIARVITTAVLVALAGVRNAGLRLEKARESVKSFQAALDGEREKYRLGFGSLVDILTIEDRLTASLAVEVQARLDAAIELAHLRQATGTLVEPNAATPRADRQAFVTLPVLQ